MEPRRQKFWGTKTCRMAGMASVKRKESEWRWEPRAFLSPLEGPAGALGHSVAPACDPHPGTWLSGQTHKPLPTTHTKMQTRRIPRGTLAQFQSRLHINRTHRTRGDPAYSLGSLNPLVIEFKGHQRFWQLPEVRFESSWT